MNYIVGEPGGPSGPFYSVVAENGNVVAMQIVSEERAHQIAYLLNLVDNWHDHFDERQRKEIEFSRYYAQVFFHGTDGHNAKMIIAKFVEFFTCSPGVTREP